MLLKHPKLDIINYIVFRFIYHLVSMIRYFSKPVEHTYYLHWTHYEFIKLQHELDNILISLIIFDKIMGFD